jgi:hypothetical protein
MQQIPDTQWSALVVLASLFSAYRPAVTLRPMIGLMTFHAKTDNYLPY